MADSRRLAIERIPSCADEAPAFWGRKTNSLKMEVIQRHAAEGDRVLDLGCGRGAYTEDLIRRGRIAVGVDRLSYPEWRRLPEGTFYEGQAEALPFPDQSFDVTLAFEILEHCPDPALALREIARCTRRKLILSVPDCDLDNALRRFNLVAAHWTDRTHCNFFVRESLRRLLEDCGYRILEMRGCVRINPNRYFWETLKLPRLVTKPLRKLCERCQLVEVYWSSILAVAAVPEK